MEGSTQAVETSDHIAIGNVLSAHPDLEGDSSVCDDLDYTLMHIAAKRGDAVAIRLLCEVCCLTALSRQDKCG